MKIVTRLGICVALVFSLTFATACQEEGGAEKAGKALDEALDDVKDEAEEAKKKLSE
jgi:outer membrane lipoprotein-sorting protein